MPKSRQKAPSKSGPELENLFLQVDSREILRVFDHLPGIHLFVKNRQGRFLRVNRALLDRLKMKEESEILGSTDYDRYPPHLADRFAATDRQVLESDQPVINQAEILYDHTGALGWFRTSKFPLHGRRGRIVAILGISTPHLSSDAIYHNPNLSRAIELVRRHRAGPLRVSEIARESGVSVRTLNRYFHQSMGITAQEFILRNRIQAAATALLETDGALSDIAIDHGFFDQSAFTRQFRLRLGITPKAYRAGYQE
jgi:AraC-like DNA-binding protein